MSEQKLYNSIFEMLNAVNVNDHIEKKNGLSYLSWAWAWAEIKTLFPLSERKVFENEGLPYFTDGKTAWVKIAFYLKATASDIERNKIDVSNYNINGKEVYTVEEIEYLQIMDYKNQAIAVEKIKSTDIMNSIQRCTVKAIARHGLGLYVYAGEDLPQEDVEKSRNEKVTNVVVELKKLQDELNKVGIDFRENVEFIKFAKEKANVKTLEIGELTTNDIEGAERLIKVYAQVVEKKKNEKKIDTTGA